MIEAVVAAGEPLRAAVPELPSDVSLCRAEWAACGLAGTLRVVWFPRKIFPHAARLAPLFEAVDPGPVADGPFDRLPAFAGGQVDAILFADERRSSPKDNLRDLMGWLQAPVIDLSGRAGDFADVHFDLSKPDTWAATARTVLAFRARRGLLAPAMRETTDPHMQLLAHAFVAGRPLAARHYPLVPDAVAYPGHWSACATVPLAHGLVQRGLLRPVFFDRMHECGGCGSRRMSAREECPACRSPELAECELIHHYHCAALLPEERFRDGARLTCPKCSQALRNYGKDYDRPGRVLACGGCARTTSEPEVGFMCLDCGRHCDGEAVRTVDIQSWHLTEAAHRLLTGAAERPEAGLDEARLGNAGRSEIERLKEAIRRSRQAGRVPSAVAQIRYAGRDGVVAASGEATFERLRRLFVENVTGHLAEAGEHMAGAAGDYLLLFSQDGAEAARLAETLELAEAVLATKIRPTVKIVARRDGSDALAGGAGAGAGRAGVAPAGTSARRTAS